MSDQIRDYYDSPAVQATKGCFQESDNKDPWKPIETAPKSGRRIMVSEFGHVHFASFLKDYGWINDHGSLLNPDHWMEAPEPPISKEIDRAQMEKLWELGAEAWKDVEDPGQWVEELRGHADVKGGER